MERDRRCRLLHKNKGVHKYFGPEPTFHPYWGRLARVLVRARGEEPTKERVLECQGLEIGRLESATCLAELLPLPKPDRASWDYAGFSDLPELADPDDYLEDVGRWRARRLRERVRAARPEAVFF